MPIGGEQLARHGAVRRLGLQPPNPAHHQPAADPLVLPLAGERQELDLGDFGIRHPVAAVGERVVGLPDRLRILVRRPSLLPIRPTAACTAAFIRAVTENHIVFLIKAATRSWR